MEQIKNPILYSYWRSSCSWRVRIVLNYKEIDYDYKSVHLVKEGGEQYKEEYTKINPSQKVPTLIIDEHVLTESMAICEYLEETRKDKQLLPSDAYQRFQVRRLCETINSGIQPLQNLPILDKVQKELNGDRTAWAKHFIQKGLDVFEALVKHSMGRYCVGDTVTLADAFLIPQLYNAERFGLDLNTFPNLLIIKNNLEELEAFKNAHPSQQPDTE